MTTALSARAYSIRARELGRHLRSAQEQSGLNNKTLAHHLGWSESRLSRVLSGRASSGDVDVSAFLAVCGVTGEGRAAILRLCRPNADANVLRLPADEHIGAYLAHSSDAAALFEYQPSLVPWIAQIPDYARAALSTWQSESDRSSEQLARRLGLATLINRPEVSLLVHEWALRNPVGTADLMSEQAHYLLRLSVRTNVSIRVIPLKSVAMPVGGFAFLEFPDYDTFVYREEATAGLFIGDVDEVRTYRELRRALYAVALDDAASRDLLNVIATESSAVADRDESLCVGR
ncbi:MAG TPA: helix-turn-helix transcriptional regulator [Pseudonocardiaceae bacterium]|nr:helix-turn-helix transcriptional regulator [Pseudonocardiaceae bacterium]